jgi:hypothetical protein
MRTLMRATVFVAVLFAASVPAAQDNRVIRVPAAQEGPRPSQLGSVTQHIHETLVTVEYSRPVARGRTIFGQLVPWEKIWTPGANDATTIAVSTDIQINGQKLAKGTYTVWSEPREGQWTIIFNSEHPVWHLRHDEVSSKDILRVTATPREAHHMETLAWYFPVVDGRRAELVVHWGTVVVPLQIDVP